MKTFTKVLFKSEFESPVDWVVEGTLKVEGYIIYKLHFDFKEGLRFSLTIPNHAICTKNPFKCLFIGLESMIIGYGKYCRLKDRVRNIDAWKHL